MYFNQTGSSVGVYLKLDWMGYWSTVQPGLDCKLVQTGFTHCKVSTERLCYIIVLSCRGNYRSSPVDSANLEFSRHLMHLLLIYWLIDLKVNNPSWLAKLVYLWVLSKTSKEGVYKSEGTTNFIPIMHGGT